MGENKNEGEYFPVYSIIYSFLKLFIIRFLCGFITFTHAFTLRSIHISPVQRRNIDFFLSLFPPSTYSGIYSSVKL